MQRSTLPLRSMILALILTLAACGAPTATPIPAPTSTNPPPAPTTEPAAANPTTVQIPPTITPSGPSATTGATSVSATNVSSTVDSAALVSTPTNVPATVVPAADNSQYVLAYNNNTTSVIRIGADGQSTDITKVAGGKPLAYLCPSAPPNQITLFTGIESKGTQGIYKPDGTSVLSLDENSGLACSLPGGIQFSPNNSRAGVLYVGADYAANPFPYGKLSVRDVAANKEQASFDSVAAFQVFDDGVLFLQLFLNDKKEANQADLMWWDGAKQRPIQREITPLTDCKFTSGRPLKVGDKVYTLFGEKCKNKPTGWRLMRTDFGGGNSANIAQAQAGGDYFAKAATNNLWALPGGSALMIAVPNGLSQEIANLLRVNLSDGAVSVILNGVITDVHPQNTPRRFVLNPAGDRLAVVTRDGNGGEAVYALNLTTLGSGDLSSIAGGKRSDRVGGLAWTADGSRLYYIISGDVNALYYQTFAGASERKLVVRGTFQGLAISPDGARVSTTEINPVAANDIRYNLVLISVESIEKKVLIEGKKDERPIQPILLR